MSEKQQVKKHVDVSKDVLNAVTASEDAASEHLEITTTTEDSTPEIDTSTENDGNEPLDSVPSVDIVNLTIEAQETTMKKVTPKARGKLTPRGPPDFDGMTIDTDEVIGCPDRQTPWKRACEDQRNGKVTARKKDGPYVALMQDVMDHNGRAKTQAHGAALLELPGGDMLAAWFSGEEGKAQGQRDWAEREWSTPELVAVKPQRSLQNPVLFYDPEKKAELPPIGAMRSASGGVYANAPHAMHSEDFGKSWTKGRIVFPKRGSFIKHPPVRSGDLKQWLLPIYFTPGGLRRANTQYSVIKKSADGGFSWSKTETLMAPRGNADVQPCIDRLWVKFIGGGGLIAKDGTLISKPIGAPLLATFRSRTSRIIGIKASFDDGVHWGPKAYTSLPNNNAANQEFEPAGGMVPCEQMAVLESGALCIVFNNQVKTSYRWPLTLALSENGGRTWPWVRDLESGPKGSVPDGAYASRGEYSYPAIMQTVDGKIHIMYTWQREVIKHVIVDEAWIRRGKDHPSRGAFQGDTYTETNIAAVVAPKEEEQQEQDILGNETSGDAE
eukprot:gene13133-15505_t